MIRVKCEALIYKMKLRIVYAFLIYCGVLIIISQGCNNSSYRDIQQGEELARKYCAGCHAFPDPSLLSKKVWGDVLPKMA